MFVKYSLIFILLLLSTPSDAIDADDQAPVISLQTLQQNTPGKPASIADYKGKLIYLDFWASWCGPCRQSFPFLKELRQKYLEQGFEIIAVNVDIELSDALSFLQNYPTDYPILLDPDAVKAITYGVEGLPTAFIIGRDGKVIYKHLGFKEKDKKWIIALIEQNLSAYKK